MYCPTVEYIRPRGHPFRAHGQYLAIHPILCALGAREPSCNPPHKALSPGRRVLRISKWPEPVNHCPLFLVHLARTIELQSITCPTPKSTLRATPGARSDPKHRHKLHHFSWASFLQNSPRIQSEATSKNHISVFNNAPVVKTNFISKLLNSPEHIPHHERD
jgi:hypothetical protein